MKSRLLLIAAFLSVSSLWSHAQSTVNFAAGTGQRDIYGIENKPLADGNYVSIGFFDPGFNILGYLNDLQAMSEAWNEYGSTTVRTIFGEPGRFAGNGSSSDPFFTDQPIYLWIFETSDASAPLSGFGNVVGYGLYTSNDPDWIFPTQGSLPPNNTTSVNSSDVDETLFGFYDASHLVLQPIPEPTALALLLLAAPLYVLAKRRS